VSDDTSASHFARRLAPAGYLLRIGAKPVMFFEKHRRPVAVDAPKFADDAHEGHDPDRRNMPSELRAGLQEQVAVTNGPLRDASSGSRFRFHAAHVGGKLRRRRVAPEPDA